MALLGGLGGVAQFGNGLFQGYNQQQKSQYDNTQMQNDLLGQQAFGNTLKALSDQGGGPMPTMSPGQPSAPAQQVSQAQQGAPPPMATNPIQKILGMFGNPQAAGAPQGAGPGGPMPPQGGAPMPQGGPPQGAPQGMPPQGAPQQGGPPQVLDWRSIAQKVAQANPGAPPQVLAAAVDRFVPLMNAESQQQWRQVSANLRQQQIDQIGQYRQDQLALGNKRADNTADLGNSRLNAQQQALEEKKREADDKLQLARDKLSVAQTDQERRAAQADMKIAIQQVEATRKQTQGDRRLDIAQENLNTRQQQFLQRESRLQTSLDARVSQAQQRIDNAANANDRKEAIKDVENAYKEYRDAMNERINADMRLNGPEKKTMIERMNKSIQDAQQKLNEAKRALPPREEPKPRQDPAGGATLSRARPAPQAASPLQSGINAQAAALPPVEALQEGMVTTFKNGQKWTLQGGIPQKVE